MMKKLVFFLFLAMLSASLFVSCAGDADTVEDETILPEVEAVPAVEEELLPSAVEEELLPAAVEEPVVEELVPEETVVEEPLVEGFEELSEDELLPEPEAESIPDPEFVPVEDENEYVIDVAGYYDGFVISEDDFIVLDTIQTEEDVVSVFTEEETVSAEDETELSSEISEEPAPEEAVVEILPADNQEITMTPAVPAPREDLAKPVEIISETEAASAAELEKEAALAEVEQILAEVPVIEEEPAPLPSRSVTINKNDILEVPYQGNWWVFLGDENGSGSLSFTGRNFVSDRTVFTLRAVKEGTAMLHFFKQDIIAGVIVDDYLEVTVGESAGVSEKTVLDDFVISQIAPIASEDECTEPDTLSELVEEEPVVAYVQYPDEEYSSETEEITAPASGSGVFIIDEEDVVTNAGEIVEDEPYTDEELFFMAQELEASDIEGALELYEQLISMYPASPYWSQASKRITYINRFYFFKR